MKVEIDGQEYVPKEQEQPECKDECIIAHGIKAQIIPSKYEKGYHLTKDKMKYINIVGPNGTNIGWVRKY